MRSCSRCSETLPPTARADARFCSTRCRVAAHRAGRVPDDLTARRRWVTRDGKRPTMPSGRPASSTDSSTWSTYDEVRQADHGFVLGDGIGCIDLDHCVVDGKISAEAQAIIDRCPPTYIEISPSGTGLHIWGHLAPGPGRCRDGVEVYSVGRYITVTGKPIPSSTRTLGDLTEVVATL